MPQLIDDATRIRVIRVLVRMSAAEFGKRLGVRGQTVTDWEHGRYEPRPVTRQKMWDLCNERGIAFLPSGMPVPYHATLTLKEKEPKNGGEGTSRTV